MIHRYEHKRQPLATRHQYFRRILWSFLLASGIMLFCLIIGILGYHYLANAAWLDALHNASMILSGMGPVIEIKTTSGKWFSSMYALFSGIIFVTNIGILLSPAMHRLFHRLHIDEELDTPKK